MSMSMSFLFRLASCSSRAVDNCAKRLAKNYMQTRLIVLVATYHGKMLNFHSSKSYSGSGTQNKTSFSALAIMLCRGLYPTTVAGRCDGNSVAGSNTA